MVYYLRFALCLAFGLAGITLVLKTVMDAIFTDWDAVDDLRRYMAGVSRRHQTRYLMMPTQAAGAVQWTSRMPSPDTASRTRQFLAPPDPFGDPRVDILPPPTLVRS